MSRKALFTTAPIKRKLTFIVMITVLAVTLITSAAFVAYHLQSLRNDMSEKLSEDAEILALNCSAALLFNDSSSANEILSSLKVRKDIVAAAVFLPNGKIFAAYKKEVEGEANTQTIRPLPDGQIVDGKFGLSRSINLYGNDVGKVYIETDMAQFYSHLTMSVLTVLGILIVALPGAYFFSLRLQKIISDPIANLAEAANRVSTEKDFSVRVEKFADDEIGTFTDAFNEMLEQILQRDIKLEQYTDNLEHEVSNRTDELRKTNEQLQIELAERKKIQDKLITAREEAEDATKLKDKFVTLVSHDLRSPFQSILSTLDMIKNDKDKISKKHIDLVGRVSETSHRMLRMIDQLLNISMIKSGRIVPNAVFFDGFITALRAITTLQHLADEKGIKITNNVKRLTRLYADPQLLDQVFQNILSNSIKFSSEGDEITFFTPEGENTTIAVSDTGTGIPKTILPDIFKHEVKTTMPGTAGEGGTGFGIPLCCDIMQAHGGELTVESEVGKGSTFFVKLPYVKPIAFVVDDDEHSITLVKNMLDGLDIETVSAKDGVSAIDTLSIVTPHIIITDIHMPEMDGYELIMYIRNNSRTKSVPIIAVSAEDSEELRDRAMRLGANDLVLKPIEPENFATRISRYVI